MTENNETLDWATIPPDQQQAYLYALLSLIVPFDPVRVGILRRLYQVFAKMNLPTTSRHNVIRTLFLRNLGLVFLSRPYSVNSCASR